MHDFFSLSKNLGSCGIGATIRIGREMLCLPYAGFFLLDISALTNPTPPYNPIPPLQWWSRILGWCRIGECVAARTWVGL